MKTLRFFLTGLFILVICSYNVLCQSIVNHNTKKIAIEWQKGQSEGILEVINGKLLKIEIIGGKGKIKGNSFEFKSNDEVRIIATLTNVQDNPGSSATIVTVRTNKNPFSFFLRDVNKEYPIYIPEYHVAVTTSDDTRSYNQIETAIKNRNLKTKLQQLGNEPEESFDSAAIHTRNQPCPNLLGLSRDMRIFRIMDNRTNPTSEMNVIKPYNSSASVNLPELENRAVEYAYIAGRGQGVEINTTRRLENGVLPILHSSFTDGDIEYHSTSFVSLEKSQLTDQTPIGTDFLVTDKFSRGNMLTKEQTDLVNQRIEVENNKTETTVLYGRHEAINKSSVPRYAWFKTVRPSATPWMKIDYSFNQETGFSTYSSGRVFGITKLDGKPMHDEEIAVLVKPNEKVVFDFFVPHTPISMERAVELSKQSFDSRYNECQIFWKGKLDRAAQISVPEKRINEMIQAGLLHLDLITYGNEPDGTLAPAIGIYSPIGTESAPIIQFYNSMGLHDMARRSIMYFLDKQHDDGMIQNFGGYMVETGAALWTMGEYFRYTKDIEWVKQVEPKLLKACNFLLQWRENNKKEELVGKGYGMIDGKVADPEDQFHQYMLNAYAYLGISRVAEMLSDLNAEQSKRLKQEAESWKKDIRNSLMKSLSNSPVVPLGDGRWCPTVPPWTEATGPRALHLIPETFFSHGTVTVPDVLLGPLYLVFCEVLAPEEQVSKMMLDYHSELFYKRNCAFSQPYYSRHNWLQLKLGLVNPFLKTYYNTFSALSDRETYTFWEHVYQASPHKTHEEGWFLMETRWMLYLEEGQTLKLLSGIPRKWLEDGKQIELRNVSSYFGKFSLQVNSNTNTGFIEATISCNSAFKPHDVVIRLPHPDGKKAIKVTGGTYDEANESILIKDFTGTANIKAEFKTN
ncbi:MAG: hypothetical protein Q8N05_00005 [Bacteroidota bacterium]|nr:hypothetical protein [Bacteroidota bacterium]